MSKNFCWYFIIHLHCCWFCVLYVFLFRLVWPLHYLSSNTLSDIVAAKKMPILENAINLNVWTHTHSRNDSFTKIVNHNSWMKSWIAQKTAIGHGIEIPKRCHSIFQFWQANREHKKRTHINSKSKQTKRSRERELEKKKKLNEMFRTHTLINSFNICIIRFRERESRSTRERKHLMLYISCIYLSLWIALGSNIAIVLNVW